MDTLFTRIEEASHAGDVNLLKELLKKDKLLLEKVTERTSGRDNPLHIAAKLGHADFVGEVISHKPELAKELNDQGFSPLHLAASEGHVTVLKELLKAGLDLCLLSEKQEGLLPLHIAVKKRRTLMVKELVDACQEAVHGLTNSGDTILHFSVKNNSFDTVEFLIDRVHNLNAKDDRGNTILHHAVASKQLSVIKYLLSRSAIDVNTMNLKFSTPLDILLESRVQNGDLIIGEMIRAVGGKTGAEVFSQPEPANRDCISNDNSSQIQTLRTSSLQQPRYLCSKNDIEKSTSVLGDDHEENEKESNPQILLLVATLVATVTFQAALNPPGGFQTDDNGHSPVGQPLLSEDLYYFVPFLMVALFLSVSVMMLLLCVVPRKKKIVMKLLMLMVWGATFSMGLAFIDGIYELYYDIYGGNDNWIYILVYGWYIVLRLGITWLLGRVLIFILKKSGLWEPVRQCSASLKRGYLLKWQQFRSTSKINWSNYCELFRKLIGIVLILAVLAGIITVWVFYKYTPLW